MYETETINEWLFCEEGVCCSQVVIAFLPSEWPVLWACPHGGRKRLPGHTAPLQPGKAAQPQLCSHIKSRDVNPGLLLGCARHAPGEAFIGCTCLQGRKKGLLGVCCNQRTSPGAAKEFGTSVSFSWHPWHVAQTSSQVKRLQMDVLMDTVVIRLPLNRRWYRAVPSRQEDRGDVSHVYICST